MLLSLASLSDSADSESLGSYRDILAFVNPVSRVLCSLRIFSRACSAEQLLAASVSRVCFAVVGVGLGSFPRARFPDDSEIEHSCYNY